MERCPAEMVGQGECPLCLESLDIDDMNFYPCTCEYQVCRFCWHRIRTNENGLCPACRKPYAEDPVNFKPFSQEELMKLKEDRKKCDQKRLCDSQEKCDTAAANIENLASLRVVQRNLILVIGLPKRLAKPDVLSRREYFGKYGSIQKIMINKQPNNDNGTCSAYITYCNGEDALRAIRSVNHAVLGDGKPLKVCLGTTKYCSNFLKSVRCGKTDCMYLHELGDKEASFTRQDMMKGKHTEYERKLISGVRSESKARNDSGQSLVNNMGEQPTGNTVHRKSKHFARKSESPVNSEAPQHGQQRNYTKCHGRGNKRDLNNHAGQRVNNRNTFGSYYPAEPPYQHFGPNGPSERFMIDEVPPPTDHPGNDYTHPIHRQTYNKIRPLITKESLIGSGGFGGYTGQTDRGFNVAAPSSPPHGPRRSPRKDLMTYANGESGSESFYSAPAPPLHPGSLHHSSGERDNFNQSQGFLRNGDFLFAQTQEPVGNPLLTGGMLSILDVNCSEEQSRGGDELGFDPYVESSKGLADLLNEEKHLQKMQSNSHSIVTPDSAGAKLVAGRFTETELIAMLTAKFDSPEKTEKVDRTESIGGGAFGKDDGGFKDPFLGVNNVCPYNLTNDVWDYGSAAFNPPINHSFIDSTGNGFAMNVFQSPTST